MRVAAFYRRVWCGSSRAPCGSTVPSSGRSLGLDELFLAQPLRPVLLPQYILHQFGRGNSTVILLNFRDSIDRPWYSGRTSRTLCVRRSCVCFKNEVPGFSVPPPPPCRPQQCIGCRSASTTGGARHGLFRVSVSRFEIVACPLPRLSFCFVREQRRFRISRCSSAICAHVSVRVCFHGTNCRRTPRSLPCTHAAGFGTVLALRVHHTLGDGMSMVSVGRAVLEAVGGGQVGVGLGSGGGGKSPSDAVVKPANRGLSNFSAIEVGTYPFLLAFVFLQSASFLPTRIPKI